LFLQFSVNTVDIIHNFKINVLSNTTLVYWIKSILHPWHISIIMWSFSGGKTCISISIVLHGLKCLVYHTGQLTTYMYCLWRTVIPVCSLASVFLYESHRLVQLCYPYGKTAISYLHVSGILAMFTQSG
jgi:hypothetical protein